MIGPIISNTLLLFAISGIAPKMMLVQKLSQIYFFVSINPYFPLNLRG
jgi:hypothetical protein